MKNVRTVVTALAATALLAAGSGLFACKKKEPETIKIGAILPLTGSAAPYGENAKNGIEIALEEINSEGGIDGKKVEVIYEDGKTEPNAGVSALKKMYEVENIPFIIGDINSTSVLAMAPYAEENHILLLSPGASNPKISNAGEYIFRNWHSDAYEGEVDAHFAFEELGWRRVAVLYVNAAYGVGLAETFKTEFEKAGGEVIAFESYGQDATDMRAQISKIIEAGPDGLFLPGWPKEMSVALKQLREMRSEIPILSVQGFYDPSIFELAGPAAEGVILSSPKAPDEKDPVVASFNKKYNERYGEAPGVCSAAGYDALRIYVEGIRKNGYDVEKVRAYMAGLESFPGADGPITFDINGDLIKPFAFLETEDAGFRIYQ